MPWSTKPLQLDLATVCLPTSEVSVDVWLGWAAYAGAGAR